MLRMGGSSDGTAGDRAVGPVAEPEQALIRLFEVSKVFAGDELESHALTRVDLSIGEGEYVSISGPSGAGKTTLLSIIGLLDSPSAGRYEFDGERLEDLGTSARARVRNRHFGFVFQSFNLIGDLSVRENVALPLRYRGRRAAEARTAATEALDRVGMVHRAEHLPHQLSGGQQQRAAIARAIVGEPRVLLADEPTGNLDSKNSDAVMGILDELHRAGTTIALVTHESRHSRRADRVIELYDGRVVGERRGGGR
jgi:putative ABC transport system ATP-binding protein